MCGIFGIYSNEIKVNSNKLKILAKHSEQRGKDSAGLVHFSLGAYNYSRADFVIKKLLKQVDWKSSNFVFGHSRLITNGQFDNQPVVRDGVIVIHNGIITNNLEIWKRINLERELEIDSEIINGIIIDSIKKGMTFKQSVLRVLELCEGTVSALIVIPRLGKAALISNNGSMYYSNENGNLLFSSEKFPLLKITDGDIKQIVSNMFEFDVPITKALRKEIDSRIKRSSLLVNPELIEQERNLLEFSIPELVRCTKCILPATMPFIEFDSYGVCNYCRNHKKSVGKKSENLLKEIISKYEEDGQVKCLVPLSGGRDSAYVLHYLIKELGVKPITFTYDWGLVTDIARRNISRITSKLEVENIIVAADIEKKRNNIKKNLKAWLKKPELGMVNILMAGDKHFFKYNRVIKKQNGLQLEFWGINSLETTHFKSGFLGLKPEIMNSEVYITKISQQIKYQILRMGAYLRNPSYLNSSLMDTISGEFYRSFVKKTDYFHLFDFVPWDEEKINEVINTYDFELSNDTSSTWRIGDGTASFYNYIYYSIAGFTEHDTFRSNQIREGLITRKDAMKNIYIENKPRYASIKWYLDLVGMDFADTISKINNITKLY